MKKLVSIYIYIGVLSFLIPGINFARHDSRIQKREAIKIKLNPVERLDKRSGNEGTEASSKTAVTQWNADASKALITFVVSGPFGKVNGKLSGLKSTIRFDENNLAASSIRASVDPKSIRTGIGLRNRDLQKEKFLDSDNHPLISFQSDKIQKSGTGYTAIGNLTLKGITRRIEIPFQFIEKGASAVFKGKFTIKRQDFGVGKEGGTIGNDVNVILEVPATKAK